MSSENEENAMEGYDWVVDHLLVIRKIRQWHNEESVWELIDSYSYILNSLFE